jgi:ATP-binding cassette subfamily F protein 3
MLRIAQLTLSRGVKRLLDRADLSVHDGHKVGLIGANGSGKSSLFAAFRGELAPDTGTIELPSKWIVAHVAQETPAHDTPAIEHVLDGDAELREIQRGLLAGAAAPHDTDAARGEALALLHHRFEAIDGYSARARAATLLAGLGVPQSRHEDPVASFSGGMRMRLNLAQALQCRSDLLLLDEPTNHLDLDAVLWLEDWLARYPGTLILITHDRDFLDRVVDSIVHIDRAKLVAYEGNYSDFEARRALALATQQAAFEKQQRKIAHLQSYVDRFRAKASKARQAQSRLKSLEKLERVAAAHVDAPFEFEVPASRIFARQLVRLESATFGYGEHRVLSNVELSVQGGAKIGLLGPNAAGKSTLLKGLAGMLAPLAGERHAAQQLRIGYFAQHQVETLRLEDSPLAHLRRLEPATREQDLKDFLGGFDFRGERATASVAGLSGGEKARLTLALIVRQRPNLLLLDEPTNHLDLEMREALTEALQGYDGALIVVAHDRHLLRATVDELWLVDRGRVAPFDGDLEDYRDWVLDRRREAPRSETAESAPPTATADRKARKRAEAQARQKRSDLRKPLVERQAALEREMNAQAAEKAELDSFLATPAAYADDAKERLKFALARTGELTWSLARLEAEWLSIAESMEKIDR